MVTLKGLEKSGNNLTLSEAFIAHLDRKSSNVCIIVGINFNCISCVDDSVCFFDCRWFAMKDLNIIKWYCIRNVPKLKSFLVTVVAIKMVP